MTEDRRRPGDDPGDPPVPIAVWRVADPDARYGHDRSNALTPRLAALLIGSHTRPGDTVVCVGDDPALAGAAGAGARTYRSVPRPDGLAGLDRAAGTVALIVLPWPPPDRPAEVTRDRLVAMFRACRWLINPAGCTILALGALPAGQTFVEHSSVLIPAARRAGLRRMQHIIAVTAPIAGQRVVPRATPADRAVLRAAVHVKVRIHLFLLAARPRRHR
jgi:hypothetical protein